MAKLTLADVANLMGNPTSAANTINANNALVETALENTLSRDGTTPNQMEADIDMNNNDLLNVDALNVESLTIAGVPVLPEDGLLVSAPDVRNFLDTAPYVETRTILKALDTTKDTVAILKEAGREGIFKWTAGDFSTQIAGDTAEGIYLKADAIASTAGAWVRVFDGAASVKWYGAAGDGVADDVVAIEAATASGLPLLWVEGTYRVTDWFRFTNAQVWIAEGTATILCDVAAGAEAQPMCDFQAFCDLRGDFLFDMQAQVKGFTLPANPINASAIVIAGDYSNIDGIRVQNAYDNGIAVVALDEDGAEIVGVPSRVTINNVRTKSCGFGTKAGAGIDVATGKYTVVTNCVDSESYTGFIVDTGAGAQCSMSNMVSIAAQMDGIGGFGFYLGSNECTYTNLHALFSENVGIWLDGYNCVLTGCQTNLTQREGLWVKRGSHSTITDIVVQSASQAGNNLYDSILIDSSGEAMDGLRINSPRVISQGGTQARYAIMHTGGNSARGSITFPDIVGHATGGINMGGQPFTIIGTDGFNAGTWGNPTSKWDVLGSFSSYAVTAAGDVGNNAVFSTSSATTPAKKIAIGYDDTNDVAIIQAIHAGVVKKDLLINPSGGWVSAGRGIWNEGALKFLNGYHFWVDASGRLRIKSGAPASDSDGTAVSDQVLTGTWTPSLLFGGAATGMTYSGQSGNYTKIGNFVFLDFAINLTAKGSSTGAATISGLPFSVSSLAIGDVRVAGGMASLNESPMLDALTGTVLNFKQINSNTGAGTGLATLTEANFTDTSNVRATVSYRAT